MQTSAYQANRNQLLLMGSTIFVSVTAAVVVSTLLIMSLMRGEIASALESNVPTSTPVSQVASTCAEPAQEYNTSSAPAHAVKYSSAPAAPTYQAAYVSSGHHYGKHYAPAATVKNSYNSTNISNIKTTNKVTNTELHKTTIIKDSFNKGSYNDFSKGSHNPVVIKDNTVNVNSNNNTSINSGNTATSNTTTNTTTNTTNNVKTNINSNNTIEKHVLSDNKVVVPVLPLVSPAV